MLRYLSASLFHVSQLSQLNSSYKDAVIHLLVPFFTPLNRAGSHVHELEVVAGGVIFPFDLHTSLIIHKIRPTKFGFVSIRVPRIERSHLPITLPQPLKGSFFRRTLRSQLLFFVEFRSLQLLSVAAHYWFKKILKKI